MVGLLPTGQGDEDHILPAGSLDLPGSPLAYPNRTIFKRTLGSYAVRPVSSLRYFCLKPDVSSRVSTNVWMANSKVPGIN